MIKVFANRPELYRFLSEAAPGVVVRVHGTGIDGETGKQFISVGTGQWVSPTSPGPGGTFRRLWPSELEAHFMVAMKARVECAGIVARKVAV